MLPLMTAIRCRLMRSFAWNVAWAILTPSALASPLRATTQPSFDDRTTAGRPETRSWGRSYHPTIMNALERYHHILSRSLKIASGSHEQN